MTGNFQNKGVKSENQPFAIVNEGELSVKEIAFKLVFSSPSYFSRIFREFY